MYLQTAQNICREYQTSAYIKIIFFSFRFSYFIFPVLSYICCRMATVPVTPKKIISYNEEIVGKRNFSVFCDSVPQLCCFLEGIYSVCMNNCYFSCKSYKVFSKINILLQLC